MTRLRSALARITHEMKPSRRRMTESLPSLRISMSCSYRVGSTSITFTTTASLLGSDTLRSLQMITAHPRIGGRGWIGAGGDRRGEPEHVLHEERRAHDGRGDPARAQASFDGAMLFRDSIPAMLRADLALENLALRQQLALLRHHSKRPRFGRFDRTFWVWLSKRWAGWREALHVV